MIEVFSKNQKLKGKGALKDIFILRCVVSYLFKTFLLLFFIFYYYYDPRTNACNVVRMRRKTTDGLQSDLLLPEVCRCIGVLVNEM